MEWTTRKPKLWTTRTGDAFGLPVRLLLKGEPMLRGLLILVMQRVCFLLQVRPERVAEYKRRHQAVWPEMRDALRASGWSNYSLFLRDDGLLVGYLETPDFEAARAAMQKLEINARWQREMSGFFVNSAGLPADLAMAPLAEIFHLE